MDHDDSRPFVELRNDYAHWCRRANEVRAIAALLNNPESRRALEGVAVGYDRLALQAEDRLEQRYKEAPDRIFD